VSDGLGLKMLSLEECRKLLDSDAKFSDEDLAMLRDQLYCWASLTLDVMDFTLCSGFDEAKSLLFDSNSVEERAAIIEFEGKVSRDQAERKAILLALENEHHELE
jgi:hypothetical protein